MVEPLADRVLALTLADEPGQLAALLLDRPRWEARWTSSRPSAGGRPSAGAAAAAAVGGRAPASRRCSPRVAPSARVEPQRPYGAAHCSQGGPSPARAQRWPRSRRRQPATAGATRPSWSASRRRTATPRAAATSWPGAPPSADPTCWRPNAYTTGVLANAALYECCLLGRDALCRALCEGYDVAAQVRYEHAGRAHNVALHSACDRGHARCLQAVLAACGASSEGTRAAARVAHQRAYGGGACPIHLAARSGAAACVRLLLDFRRVPLCCADERVASDAGDQLAAGGTSRPPRSCSRTTRRGKRPKRPNSRRSTPRRPRPADVSARSNAARPELLRVEDPDHRTPLATAVSHGKLESARLLAIAGAAPRRRSAVDLRRRGPRAKSPGAGRVAPRHLRLPRRRRAATGFVLRAGPGRHTGS